MAGTQRVTSLPAPGMLDKHYAPNARLIIAQDVDDLLAQYSALSAEHAVGLLLMGADLQRCQHLTGPVFSLGESLEHAAQRLYAGLRALDSANVGVILTVAIPRTGLGEAIADRLQRAAAK